MTIPNDSKLTFFQSAQQMARERFNNSEVLEPFIIGLHPILGPSPAIPVGHLMVSQQSKDYVAMVLCGMVQQGFSEIVFVCETYRIAYPKGSDPDKCEKESSEWITKHGTLRDHPLTKEFVMATRYTDAGDEMLFAEIPEGRHELGPWEGFAPASDTTKGRFTSLFKRAREIERN